MILSKSDSLLDAFCIDIVYVESFIIIIRITNFSDFFVEVLLSSKMYFPLVAVVDPAAIYNLPSVFIALILL